jgi:hypothetical protein
MPARSSSGRVNKFAADIVTDFAKSVLVLFEGTQPASADDDESGYTIVAVITIASGAFTGGSPTNGLDLEVGATGIAQKPSGAIWSGVNIKGSSATVGWGRLYDNAYTTGASTSADRIDFNAAPSGAPLTMANTTVAAGATITIDTCLVTVPQ